MLHTGGQKSSCISTMIKAGVNVSFEVSASSTAMIVLLNMF